jgi:hypothetical protein
MKEFLFIIRTEGDIWTLLSPDKLQLHIEHGTAYIQQLIDKGKIKSAQPLDKGSRVVTKADGIFKDAPFIESKEVIAGYFLIEAETMEEAIKVAMDNPIFEDIPSTIEIHPIKQIPAPV